MSMPRSVDFRSCMTDCRSSLLLLVTRPCSPWIEAWTLSLEPLITFTISRALSEGMPSCRVTFWRAVWPSAFSTSPKVSAFRGTFLLTRRSSSTSRTAFIFESSPEVMRISLPWSSTFELDPLRSKRVVISFMAWEIAFFTSCMSTLLTTSNELSAKVTSCLGWRAATSPPGVCQTSGYRESAPEVGERGGSDDFRGFAAQAGDDADDFDHERGLVPLAAMRGRGQERAVRLHQQ